MSEEMQSTPPELLEIAKSSIETLIPTKSKKVYDYAYTKFVKWSEENHVHFYSENVLISYFTNLSEKFKSSTMWSHYSMLKSELNIKHNVKIENYSKLIAFLKRKGDNYKPKKSKVFSKQEFDNFLKNAPNKRYLATKIGTTNLLSIERGGVRIQSCPQLCFLNTVNWAALGAQRNKILQTETDCEPCPVRCQGSCWNSTHCMDIERGCHEECLGCTQKNSIKHCKLCKNVRNNGNCVNECPKNKYDLQLLHECITKEDCLNFKNENYIYFIHESNKMHKREKQCINECPKFYKLQEKIISEKKVIRYCDFCGYDCVKNCTTDPLETEEAIKKLNGCTHIQGPLIIRNLKIPEPEKLLNEHLGSIKNINGTLKILRTKLNSLDFLKNVTYIGLNDTEVPKSIYSIVIYENPNLQKLWDFNTTLRLKGKYSFHDNPLLCLSEIKNLRYSTNVTYDSPIDVSENSNGEQATCSTVNITDQVTVTASSTNATLVWYPPKLGYNESYIITVYYKENKGKNATFSNNTRCETSDWNKVYGASSGKFITFLDDLSPFSTYAFYIKSYISKGDDGSASQSDTISDSTSDMMYFETSSDDPDGFRFLKVTPIDYQTINLNWTKPKSPNGILAVYRLSYIELQEDFLFERDYCKYQRRPDGDKIDDDEEEDYNDLFYQDDSNKTTVVKPVTVCNCSESTQDVPEEFEIITKGAKSQLCNDIAKSSNEKQQCMNFEYQIEKRRKRSSYRDQEIKPSETSFNVTGLNPFTMYVFYLSACNEPKDKYCSGVLQRFARTEKKPDADIIEKLKLEYHGDSTVNISWNPPSIPNTPIVAYRIHITSENSESVIYCIPMFNISSKRMFKIYNELTPGKHLITVQAESLAGIANGVTSHLVVPYPSGTHGSLIAISVTTLVIACLVLSAYWVYRTKKIDGIHLITTINPDYEGTVYIQDHWEMDKDDIELVKELGRGNFGTVYQGLILSRNLPCAVKVVNESLNIHQRMEFLMEASVMKSFNDCYHVVKLLGVVSVHQPPTVIMELMERGDLKKFLRKIRDSSQNLTSSEIYRMAVEIADGMAYLSAKKFVHRDLAARNCMVAADRTVKVGDFGMARDIYTTDYYRKASKGLLPVRWMAPESLADGVFTTDSDVWSYGIVLWEIATLAEQPYQGLSNEHVRQFIISKGRLNRPPECSDFLYEIMRQCWSWRPCDRPTFWDIVERLEDRVSEDFKLVSFAHSREASLYSRQRVDNPAALGTAPRDDLMCHYNASDEDISLHVGGVPRRQSYLQASISHRRFSPPDDIY